MFEAKFPEMRQESYLDALEGVHAENIMWACKEAAKKCDYFPVPAKLIELSHQAPRLNQDALKLTQIETLTDEQREINKKRIAELLASFEVKDTLAN